MPSRRPVDQRFRYLYRPLTFCACLVPLAGCAGGILRLSGYGWVPGFNLGVDPVRYVLDVLGKTALNILLVTLLVSPVRQLSGWSNLIRLRRMLGLFAFFYALLHFVMYIGPFQGFSWLAILQDIGKRPWITLGFAALVLLTPLAITSTQGMMRRLGRRWQQLHRLIYVIPILGILHYWKMLKLSYREPAIYGAILAVLLGWRLWRRLRHPSVRAPATSKSVAPKAPGTA